MAIGTSEIIDTDVDYDNAPEPNVNETLTDDQIAPEQETAPADPGAEPKGEATAPVAEDQEPSPASEADATGEDADDKRANNLIPRHRYNYAARKRREAEAELETMRQELEQLRAQQEQAAQQEPQPQEPQGPTLDQVYGRLSQLDAAIEDARIDGKREDVIRLRQEQRYLEQYAAAQQFKAPEAPAQPQSPAIDPNQMTQQVLETLQTRDTADRLESEYPMFNADSDQFNPEVTDEVMELFTDFVNTRGMARPEALEQAVRYVAGAYGFQKVGQGAANQARQAQIKANLAAAQAQPTDISEVGLGSEKAGVTRSLDVMNMSQEDFESLSDKDLDSLLV